MYIKAFDKDLKGSESFQFEVGKTYTTKADNPVVWFHYGDKATTALCFYPKEDTRFCIVEPLGRTHTRYHHRCVTVKSFATDAIRIVRELSHDEVCRLLFEEHCPWWLANYLKPPFEVMAKYGNSLRGELAVSEILTKRSDLTVDQHLALLPKKHHLTVYKYHYRKTIAMQKLKCAEQPAQPTANSVGVGAP
jgi:hypothetical protein